MQEVLGTLLALLLWVGFYVCVSAFFSSIKRAALRQHPRQDGAALEFFPTTPMQTLVRSVLILLAAFGILVSMATRGQGANLYALLIPAAVFLSVCLVRPVSVVVDDRGIRQRRWFLHDKEIKWADVASVEYGAKTGTTYVLPKNGGPKIGFSAFLVGRTRFEHAIHGHARDADVRPESED
jgi:hypothetical protein